MQSYTIDFHGDLDIQLQLPSSLFKQEPQAPAFVPPEAQTTPDTGPGSVVTGQGPTIQGSTLDPVTKKAIVSDMDITEILAERQG